MIIIFKIIYNGGESVDSIKERISKYYQKQNAGQKILSVTHEGIIRTILWNHKIKPPKMKNLYSIYLQIDEQQKVKIEGIFEGIK